MCFPSSSPALEQNPPPSLQSTLCYLGILSFLRCFVFYRPACSSSHLRPVQQLPLLDSISWLDKTDLYSYRTLSTPRSRCLTSAVASLSMSNSQTDERIKNTQVLVRARTSSSSSSGLTLQTPRTARFAEATSVNSPIYPTTTGRNPFTDPPITTQHLMPQAQPSDVGFGYMADNQPSKHSSYAGVEVPLTPNSPLKSALKPPGTPGRLANPLSPTFHEEQILEQKEQHAEKQNAKDLVRLAPTHVIHSSLRSYRKSKLVSVWLKWLSGGQTSAVALSCWPCFQLPSLFSMLPDH